VNPATGKLYKDELCSQSGPQGVIVMGASAQVGETSVFFVCNTETKIIIQQAHFEIPPIWLDAAKINFTTYDDVIFAVQNEMDWPHRSWYLILSIS